MNTLEKIEHLNKIDRNEHKTAECPKGFQWTIDGTCENINECRMQQSVCRRSSYCVDYIGRFSCYTSFIQEAKLCHHTPINVTDENFKNGPLCNCFSGSLCDDILGCTCGDIEWRSKREVNAENIKTFKNQRFTSKFESNSLSVQTRKIQVQKWKKRKSKNTRKFPGIDVSGCGGTDLENTFLLDGK